MDISDWNGTSGGLRSEEQGYRGTGYLKGSKRAGYSTSKTFVPQACWQAADTSTNRSSDAVTLK